MINAIPFSTVSHKANVNMSVPIEYFHCLIEAEMVATIRMLVTTAIHLKTNSVITKITSTFVNCLDSCVELNVTFNILMLLLFSIIKCHITITVWVTSHKLNIVFTYL